MLKKKKFRPVITRVKLNPEQAVLMCGCYTGWYKTTDIPTNQGSYGPEEVCQAVSEKNKAIRVRCLGTGSPTNGNCTCVTSDIGS
jgi:hypothetical protein